MDTYEGPSAEERRLMGLDNPQLKKWQQDILIDKNLSPIAACMDRTCEILNKKPANDPVNHPSHYTDGKIEVIDFIEDKKLGFHLGNAVKYIARAGKKDPSKKVEDLKKAKWYLDRYIDMLTRTDPITYKDYIPPQFGGDTDGDNLTMPIQKTVLGDEHAINLCHLDQCAQASSKPEDYKGVTAQC